MRAIVIERPGGPDVLRLGELPDLTQGRESYWFVSTPRR